MSHWLVVATCPAHCHSIISYEEKAGWHTFEGVFDCDHPTSAALN